MILCHYMNEHTLRVTGGTVIYRYSTTESSLYLFTHSVRVPGSRLRFLPEIESVAKNRPKGA